MGIITISTQQGIHSPLVAFLSLKNKSLEFLKDLCSAFLLKTILIFLDIQVRQKKKKKSEKFLQWVEVVA